MKKYYGTVAFMGFTIAFVLLFAYLTPEPKQPTQGIPHNYYTPDVWEDTLEFNSEDFIDIDSIEEHDCQLMDKEAIDWTGTTQGEDTLGVRATMYHPVEAQCDDSPLITADGSRIHPYQVSDWNWIAVSQDLLWFNDGPIRYGDVVYIIAGHKTGTYIVRDAMNKRFKFKIDFLESVGTDLYSFDNVKLVINS